jgi:hypothetical protein
MPDYEIVVTDVTNYGSTLYCVAGWELRHRGMIRPEPPTARAADEPSRFWDMRFAGPGRNFAVGKVLRFEAATPPADFLFPHATEDRIIPRVTNIEVVDELDEVEMIAAAAGSVSRTLEDVFNDGLVRANSGKAYVPMGFEGRSLGAVEMAANRIRFFEQTSERGKSLRARVTIRDLTYDLSVTADAVRTRWAVAGLAGLQQDQAKADCIHLRVGLARPYAQMNNNCYAQINGVYFL